MCEQAAALVAAKQPEAAVLLVQQAIATAPQAPRPRIDLAALQQQAGRFDEAFATLRTLAETAPIAMPLIAPQIATVAVQAGQAPAALDLLEASYAESPSIDVLEAIVSLQSIDPAQAGAARFRYVDHLDHEQSLVAAARWIAGEKLEHEEFHPRVQRALDHATKPLTRYRCAACGFEAKQHFWQCPGCQAWDSYPARRVEEL
ncbi:MAG: lipopolysaccharide assembly protein LapB [Polaromonas sp.]|nr:lipopolysaccharide assembly protein LapB [Polaromonas sp.]